MELVVLCLLNLSFLLILNSAKNDNISINNSKSTNRIVPNNDTINKEYKIKLERYNGEVNEKDT